MKLGLTYDLADEYLACGYTAEETADLDSIETVEHIEDVLHGLGHETTRIGGAKQLTRELARGERWDLVFNIAEGMHGFGREAQVPAMLDAFRIPYTFADPLAATLTLHKAMAKRVVRDLGLATAEFAVVEEASEIEDVALLFPVAVKPVAKGTGMGISEASRAQNPGDLRTLCAQLLRQYREPVLVEEYLPGMELTVGIVGSGKGARVVGVMEIALKDEADRWFYSYRNKRNWETVVEYAMCGDAALFKAASALALAAWRGLGCRDAGRIDIRLDAAGIPNFLEATPLPGLRRAHGDLPILCEMCGLEYERLIEQIVESAMQRAPREDLPRAPRTTP